MVIAATSTAFAALEATLEQQRQRVDVALRHWHRQGGAPLVTAAAEDSLFAPAKRLRPILTLLVSELLRGDVNAALPAGCAVEMVHTASLILDDLPCMDNARLRRGQPACHVRHGEASAILAAFALQTRAFEILAEGWPGGPDGSVREHLGRELALAIGTDGLIAGQSVDLAMVGQPLNFATLEFIHSRKTGALFTAAAVLGALVAQALPTDVQAIRAYAKNIGLAFQIVDDIIDVTAEAGDIGKDVGQDTQKTTFVSFAGVAGARQLAEELVVASHDALTGFGVRAAPLRELARYVVARRR
jgi:geranylgeranyl diphosphate synthase type II